MNDYRLKLNRTLGFEIEGFVYDDDIAVPHSQVGWDSSLEDGNGCAVEVRTEPINNLNYIKDIYDKLDNENFNVNDSCGLHIHVDTSDFSVKDKVKLLRFGAGIELLMYTLVDEDRYQNTFCQKLHHSWRKMFKEENFPTPIPYDTFQSLPEFESWINRETNITSRCWNGRYQWMNANVGHAPTVEFRLFDARTDYEEVQNYGMLAYHIVETVKNSTIRQLSFIIKSLYECNSVDEMYSKLFDSIGLHHDFRPMIKNDSLADYLHNKYCVPQVAETNSEAV